MSYTQPLSLSPLYICLLLLPLECKLQVQGCHRSYLLCLAHRSNLPCMPAQGAAEMGSVSVTPSSPGARHQPLVVTTMTQAPGPQSDVEAVPRL